MSLPGWESRFFCPNQKKLASFGCTGEISKNPNASILTNLQAEIQWQKRTTENYSSSSSKWEPGLGSNRKSSGFLASSAISKPLLPSPSRKIIFSCAGRPWPPKNKYIKQKKTFRWRTTNHWFLLLQVQVQGTVKYVKDDLKDVNQLMRKNPGANRGILSSSRLRSNGDQSIQEFQRTKPSHFSVQTWHADLFWKLPSDKILQPKLHPKCWPKLGDADQFNPTKIEVCTSSPQKKPQTLGGGGNKKCTNSCHGCQNGVCFCWLPCETPHLPE